MSNYIDNEGLFQKGVSTRSWPVNTPDAPTSEPAPSGVPMADGTREAQPFSTSERSINRYALAAMFFVGMNVSNGLHHAFNRVLLDPEHAERDQFIAESLANERVMSALQNQRISVLEMEQMRLAPLMTPAVATNIVFDKDEDFRIESDSRIDLRFGGSGTGLYLGTGSRPPYDVRFESATELEIARVTPEGVITYAKGKTCEDVLRAMTTGYVRKKTCEETILGIAGITVDIAGDIKSSRCDFTTTHDGYLFCESN
jgi:hypothetical protein